MLKKEVTPPDERRHNSPDGLTDSANPSAVHYRHIRRQVKRKIQLFWKFILALHSGVLSADTDVADGDRLSRIVTNGQHSLGTGPRSQAVSVCVTD